jgi:hypothetical protein
VGYFSWIATDMVAGADAHPAFGFARQRLPGLLGRVSPVSQVGDAVADGIERRRRWITVPSWIRPLLVLRGALLPLYDLGSRQMAAEMDRRFERDVEQRGAEASAPVGAGGAAVRESVVNRR